MNLVAYHMIAVFGWALFLTSLILSLNKKNSKVFAVLSLVFMFSVLFIGTKLMLMMPGIAKSGMWIHVKLSIDIAAMLLNVYLAVKVFKGAQIGEKAAGVFYWLNVGMFFAMYVLTLFRPF